MDTYRICPVNAGAGTIGPSKVLECTSQFEAIAEARKMLINSAVEVWCGDNLIIRLDRRSS